MNYFKGLVSNVKGFYDGITTATLTGAIDVIVVRQEDGSLVGSPFHVRFGKLGVLRAREKVVDISVNNKDVDLHMKLGVAGEAFFVQECQEESVPSELATSPLPSLEGLMAQGIQELHNQEHKEALDKLRASHSIASQESNPDAEFVTGITENEAATPLPSPKPSSHPYEPLLKHDSIKARKTSEEIIENPLSYKEFAPNEDGNLSSSPLKRSLSEYASSKSIPIPASGNKNQRQAVYEDDLASMTSSPYDAEVYLRVSEYPLSDVDLETSSKDHKNDPRRVLSDTEAELSGMLLSDSEKPDDVTWEWGELPQGPTKMEKITLEPCRRKRTEKSSKSRPKSSEGLYLDDVLQADREVAALYLNRQTACLEVDVDSGIGQDSKPVSPADNHIGLLQLMPAVHGTPKNVSMSLCGELKKGKVDIEKFEESLVSYEELCKNPSILNDPKLVVRMDKKFYNWQVAAPYIMSLIVFGKPLCRNTMVTLKQQHMPRKRKGWFSWRTPNEDPETSDEEDANRKPERHHRSRSLKPGPDIEIDIGMSAEHRARGKDRYKKVTRLSSSQWESLGLHDGTNDVTFSVTTQYQGTAACSAKIFLWNYYDRIVISDIDGTITKSDVIGQILPLVGRDWSQSGVTELFTNIEKNGYRFMYLSARAIGQAQLTRDFLKSVRQGEETLPDGPMFLSPTSLIKAFQREVIEKKPEIFKIACMRDIKNIFPQTRNPFYSGFGNKVNDVWAYRALGIPISRIFTINYKGEIKHELTNAFSSSYGKLVSLVDHMFPPLTSAKIEDTVSPDFSTFNYWKTPFPEIVEDINSMSDDENVGL